MYHHVQTSEVLHSAHNVFTRILWISEKKAILSLYIIKLIGFITEVGVYCAIRTGPLHAQIHSVLKGITFKWVLETAVEVVHCIYLKISFCVITSYRVIDSFTRFGEMFYLHL